MLKFGVLLKVEQARIEYNLFSFNQFQTALREMATARIGPEKPWFAFAPSVKHNMGSNSLAPAPAVPELSPSQQRATDDKNGHLFLFLLGEVPCLSENISQHSQN